MADESDVEAALVGIIASAIYPNGIGAASALLNAAPCRVFRGWPVEQNLKSDLAQGIANVSVYARNGVEVNRTVYSRDAQEVSRTSPTLTATVSDNTITIGGAVSTPQNVHIKAGVGASVAYAVQPADTTTTIATGLAIALAAKFPGTTNVGPVITIPVSAHAGLLTTRVTTAGQVARELKRQDKSFQIALWSPTPELRDSLAKVVDPALAEPVFVNFADGSCGWIRYEYTIIMDTPQEEGLYQRDLFYRVEYPTLKLEAATEIGAIALGITGAQVDPSFSPNNPAAPPPPANSTII